MILAPLDGLEKGVFSDCPRLSSVTLPDGMSAIGEGVFLNCAGLTAFNFPASLRGIGESAFANCTGLTELAFPANLKTIGFCSFSGCTALERLALPNGLIQIDQSAFANCSALTSVTIPTSVMTFGIQVFSGCSELSEIRVDPANRWFCDMDGVMFSADGKMLIAYPNGRTGGYVVPEGVESIYYRAFESCSALSSLVLQPGLTELNSIIYNCPALTELTVPETVTHINAGVFSRYSCPALTDVFYSGTEEAWNEITIDSNNDKLESAALHCQRAVVLDCGENGSLSAEVDALPVSYALDGCSVTLIVTPDEGYQLDTLTVMRGEEEISVTDNSFTMPLGSVTVTARFRPSLLVSYEPNGGDSAPETQIKIVGEALELSSEELTREDSVENILVTLDANGGSVNPRRLSASRFISYDFTGWNSLPDGSGEHYAPGGYYTADESAVLYAEWELSVEESPVFLPTPTREGFVFLGWGAESEAVEGITGYYMPEASVTLCALWMKTYAVTYDPNGGENAPEAQVKTPGEALELSGEIPVREGWYFIGWAERADAEAPDYLPGGSFTRDEDTVLCALWAQPDLVLPAALTEIEEEAFSGGAFRFVKLPENTRRISALAFAACPNLRFAILPAGLTEIDASAFEGAEGLTILGEEDSPAERFAEARGFGFIPLG